MEMESINPIEIYEAIKKKYLSFILTSICRNNISLERELKELYLNKDLLWRDLMLQSLPEYKRVDSEDFNSLNFDKDLITLQKVPPIIYPASYPAWILSENNLLNFFVENNYQLITDFVSLGGEFMVKRYHGECVYKGYLFGLINK